MLKECDRHKAKQDRYEDLKKSRKIAKARLKMTVGNEQPRNKERMPSAKTKSDQLASDALEYTLTPIGVLGSRICACKTHCSNPHRLEKQPYCHC